MCILLNVKKHEKTFALNVDIFKYCMIMHKMFEKLQKKRYTIKRMEIQKYGKF